MDPKVVAVCTSLTRGERKKPVGAIEVRPGLGVVGDAHAGDPFRQVSLLAQESIKKKQLLGLFFDPNDYAENIITKGITLSALQIGSRLIMGGAVVEVTQVGGECSAASEGHVGFCDCSTAEDVFVKVLQGGVIRPGDRIIKAEAD